MAYNPFQPPKVQTTVPGISAPSFAQPWLLYAHPWMPYSRRVLIYMREKGIPESQIKFVQVQGSNVITPNCPPRPLGSLPILAIPFSGARELEDDGEQPPYIYIRHSNAIMTFLEELCTDFQYGFNQPHGSLLGRLKSPLHRARIFEIWSVADEALTTAFRSIPNPTPHPSLVALARFFADRDMSLLRSGKPSQTSIGDVAVYSLLEFVHDVYGTDLTAEHEELQKLREFYQTFRERESTKRDATKGEIPPEDAKEIVAKWTTSGSL